MPADDVDADQPRWLEDDEQVAWRRLAAVIQLLPAALDRQLQRDAKVSHAYYMILAMLSEAPHRSMRMRALAELVSASQSRLSHAVSRLEERGWVTRTPTSADGRGQVCTLTDEGFDTLVTMAPGHVEEVRRRVFDRLTREQVEQFSEILAALVGPLVEETVPKGSATSAVHTMATAQHLT